MNRQQEVSGVPYFVWHTRCARQNVVVNTLSTSHITLIKHTVFKISDNRYNAMLSSSDLYMWAIQIWTLPNIFNKVLSGVLRKQGKGEMVVSPIKGESTTIVVWAGLETIPHKILNLGLQAFTSFIVSAMIATTSNT